MFKKKNPNKPAEVWLGGTCQDSIPFLVIPILYQEAANLFNSHVQENWHKLKSHDIMFQTNKQTPENSSYFRDHCGNGRSPSSNPSVRLAVGN